MALTETVVISVGGSLIVPDEINTEFLQKLKRVLLSRAREGMHFILITGGGYPTRWYQKKAREMGVADAEALDWMGIYSTYLNASLLLSILGESAVSIIGKDPFISHVREAPILVGGGWKPGASSDRAAVRMARLVGARRMVNLSNISYVYDQDPRINENAQAFPKLSWSEFQDIIPKEWEPGMNVPFDPIAAKEAKKQDLEVAVIHGRHLIELEHYLAEKSFKGTLIKGV